MLNSVFHIEIDDVHPENPGGEVELAVGDILISDKPSAGPREV